MELETTAIETFTVLLVEDSPTEAMLVTACLEEGEDTRFQIQHVSSLAEALNQLAARPYDVVVLDLTLPDCSGPETFILLHKACPSVPVVVLTANASRATAVRMVQLGAQDYILKEQIESLQLPLSLRYAIERKKSQEALRTAHAELELAYQQLQATQAQLVQNAKLASIGQLAAGVAHEMNTPLGFITSNIQTLKGYVQKLLTLQGQVDLLLKDLSGSSDATMRSKAEAIIQTRAKLKIDFVLGDADSLLAESHEGLATLTGIVQSLREFTRVDQAEAFAFYDINRGIESTLVMARSELKDIDVGLDLGPIPAVPCDAVQINEVFLNIVRNAVEAIRTRGPHPDGRIAIRTRATDTSVVCEIEDNGPGIPEDVLPKIFDPFFTTKPVGAGKGLGLSIAHDIVVQKHSGQLRVQTQPGHGTTFIVELIRVPHRAGPEGSKEPKQAT